MFLEKTVFQKLITPSRLNGLIKGKSMYLTAPVSFASGN